MIPGEYILESQPVQANGGREPVMITVRSVGDRPIQIGSHFHFFEVNRALEFDRAAAYGMRLNIPAGTATRFEPGEEKQVALVPVGGARRMFGHSALVEGALDDPAIRQRAMDRLAQFLGTPTRKDNP